MRLRAGLLILCWLALAAFKAVEAKPNIVLILTDDQETDLTQYMPTVRSAIIEKGVTLTRAFYYDPICCPSRATILTGRYGHNTRVFVNAHSAFYNAGNDSRTFAVWLQAAGYRNYMIGKYLNGYPLPRGQDYIPPGWNGDWSARSGVGEGYYNYRQTENGGRTRKYGSTPADYATDVYGARAVEYIREAVADDVPFFVWLGFSAPHSPATPAPRHATALSGVKAPRSLAFNERDVSDKPSHIRRLGEIGTSARTELDANYRNRARTLLAVDEAVSAIVRTLRELGELDETYIVFASDNGLGQGQHRVVRNKGLPYEEHLRMVLHIRGPGLPQGVEHDYLTGNVDLAPTFAAWVGATAPSSVDGRSIAELLRNPTATGGWRSAMPIAHSAEADKWPAWRGIRTKDEVYVEYPATSEVEHYDLRTDPWQLDNTAGSLSAARRAAFSELTGSLGSCRGNGCRTLDRRRP